MKSRVYRYPGNISVKAGWAGLSFWKAVHWTQYIPDHITTPRSGSTVCVKGQGKRLILSNEGKLVACELWTIMLAHTEDYRMLNGVPSTLYYYKYIAIIM